MSQEIGPAVLPKRKGAERKAGWNFAAPPLLLLAPFTTFILYHGYDPLSPEALWVAGLIVAGGLATGAVAHVLPAPIRALILAVVVALSVDLLAPYAGSLLLAAPFVATLVGAALLREHLTTVLAVMAGASIAVTFAAPDRAELYAVEGGASTGAEASAPAPTVTDSSLPPIVHLILDEYAGVEGLPTDSELATPIADEIKALFVGNGFRLHGGAYSQYFNTYNSIGNTLNFTSEGTDAGHFEEVREPYHLRENAYFAALAERGYDFRIYQSSYLDYCRTPGLSLATCETYVVNSIGYLEGLPIPTAQKAAFIRRSFFGLSEIRTVVRAFYNGAWGAQPDGILPLWDARVAMVGPIPVLPLFDRIAGDIEAHGGGTVYFAHLLIPHSPYLLDETCAVKTDTDEWRARRNHELPLALANTPESRQATYAAYVAQLRCANRLLADFFGLLDASGHFDDAIVVIHGDHGARINRRWPTASNREALVESDFLDGFPTLFAVKAPGIDAGYTAKRDILPALLAEALALPVTAPNDQGIHFFTGLGREMERGAMPADWMEATPP